MPPEVQAYFKAGKKRLTRIIPHLDYCLNLEFDNGEMRVYDLKNRLTGVFEVLLEKERFDEVFIDENGNIAWDVNPNIDSAVAWDNRIDLCADSAYIYSKPQEENYVEEN